MTPRDAAVWLGAFAKVLAWCAVGCVTGPAVAWLGKEAIAAAARLCGASAFTAELLGVVGLIPLGLVLAAAALAGWRAVHDERMRRTLAAYYDQGMTVGEAMAAFDRAAAIKRDAVSP